ncbi:sodium:solute symporter family transporter [Streptomyces niveiscabiei]|uniref:sodium/solute symporter n=2 Tax=Streptomyces niveiscabiei TaxID=164115 RepID=UPI003EBD703D
MNSSYAIPAVALVVVATVLVGAFGLRISRTTSDFYVASRTVGPRLNAAAISGEYLSAASFLGIAGLVLVQGPDMLWYPVGYTAGYLVLLLFVAAPLRRSGAYTLPDFAEARLASRTVRRLAGTFVVGVGWLYLLPQLQGAGLTLTVLTGAPGWLGGVIVAVVVTVTVAAGGMRSITFVQAFQYWLKLTALLVPAIFLALAWHSDGGPKQAFDEPANFREQRSVRVDATLDLNLASPLTVKVTGRVDGRRYSGTEVSLPMGTHRVERGTRLVFPQGGDVPTADRGATGGMSTSLAAGREERPLYATYGLILATFFGTMGLPHVVVRFYTSPHGVAARRTTVAVLALIGAFYLLPPLYGALGRLYAPELALTGDADAAVLLLPDRIIGGLGGDLLGAFVAGGAFAAFLSTASGLTMAVAGVLTQDVLPTRGVRHFRLGTALAMAAPLAASLLVGGLPVADAVGLAFAVSASSFCPLLVLGIWWRRLTPPGAAAGMLVGGGSAFVAVATTMAGLPVTGTLHALLAWPALWSVPLGFLTMILTSLATPGRVPPGTAAILARFHLPEELVGEGRALPGGGVAEPYAGAPEPYAGAACDRVPPQARPSGEGRAAQEDRVPYQSAPPSPGERSVLPAPEAGS